MRYYKELLAFQALIYVLFWLTNEYIAFMLCIVTIPICLSIAAIAKISDMIEKSRISNDFYRLMIGLAIIPFFLLTIFWLINGMVFEWMINNK